MYLKIIDDKRKDILKELDQMDFISKFVLGGGTALSLQLGLRESYDFDFFSLEHFDPLQIENEIKRKTKREVRTERIETELSTLYLLIDGVQVSFFEYRYPPIGPCVLLDSFKNISLFSLGDIVCMKAVAIAQRGTKKDFFDFYFLLEHGKYKPLELKEILFSKFKSDQAFTNLYISLIYFDEADAQTLPIAFVNFNWEKIKEALKKYHSLITNLGEKQ